MANGVSTEWDDIQRKLGNFEAKERVPEQWELNEIAKEKLLTHEREKAEDKMNLNKNRTDSDDLLDEFGDDDDFMKEYQQKRMAEFKEISKKPHFGSVYEISRDQYIEQVSNAPAESWVLIHLYETANPYCLLINDLLTRLAAEYPLVKFVKIVATKCVEGFPDSNCPCFIIYKGGRMVGTYHSVNNLIGKISKDSLELFLHRHSIIYSENCVRPDESVAEIKNILNNPYKRGNGTGYLENLDDREYADNEIKEFKKK